MFKLKMLLLGGLIVIVTGCASTQQKPPEVKRISPEELDRILPKPVPNLSIEEVVKLSKAGTPPEEIIEKIKASNSRYDITPSQAVQLSKQGVSPKVLDYIYQTREAALREGFADEINRREKEKQLEKERLQREYQLRYTPPYDPWWNYPPYWRPLYGPSFNYRRGW